MDAAPGLDRLRRPEPSVAKGWRSVWDALEGMHTIGKGATHLSATGLDDNVHLPDPHGLPPFSRMIANPGRAICSRKLLSNAGISPSQSGKKEEDVLGPADVILRLLEDGRHAAFLPVLLTA